MSSDCLGGSTVRDHQSRPDASDALSRFGQARAHQVPVKRVPQPGMRQAAMLLMQATPGPSSMASKALMIQTMMQMLKSMYDYQQATSQKQAARQVEVAVRGSLMEVRKSLPAVPATAGAPTARAVVRAPRPTCSRSPDRCLHTTRSSRLCVHCCRTRTPHGPPAPGHRSGQPPGQNPGHGNGRRR